MSHAQIRLFPTKPAKPELARWIFAIGMIALLTPWFAESVLDMPKAAGWMLAAIPGTVWLIGYVMHTRRDKRWQVDYLRWQIENLQEAIRGYDERIEKGQEPYDDEIYEDGYEFEMKLRKRMAMEQLDEIKARLDMLLDP